jgi:hypothetical protein
LNLNHWKQHAPRVYRKESKSFTAFVFGATAPMTMWAWVVWNSDGESAGVNFTLKKAKESADKVIAQLQK